MYNAFTLIELLVVITIIVVLLALLTPALDKAIYQAELAVCAANLDALGTSVLAYAFEHRRRYPYRPGVHHRGWNWRDTQIALPPPMGTSSTDDRPLFKTFISVNKNLNCPLNKFIDLEASTASTEAAYQLWFGFQFRHTAQGGTGGAFDGPTEPGMLKVGDRLTWTDPNGTSRFNVLASDMDLVLEAIQDVLATHPDKDGKLVQFWTFNSDTGTDFGFLTVSRWHMPQAGTPDRGPMDRNFLHADGSVRRLTDLTIEDARNPPPGMAKAPIATNSDSIATDYTTLPTD
jgi:prepilin-type N-terminal cleavage/methylation domain-containing protein